MSNDGKNIVFLGACSPIMRKALLDYLPDGFRLTFADVKTDEEAVLAVADADYIPIAAAHVRTMVVEAAARAGTRLIQKIGEGTDRFDVVTARRLGVQMARTTGSNSASVAELNTLLILATLRWLPRAHNSVVAGKWLKFELRPGNYELRGKQVGIIGLGKIGLLLARQMQAFDASVVYYKRTPYSEAEEAALGVRYMPLDDLLRTSDVVSVQVPSMPSTRGLIGARELALMKPTAILVNACRGGIVDEEALYQALKERRIRGAGTDVFSKEPPDPDNPLFSLDNVVLTPHYAGGTEDCEIEGVKHFYRNMLKIEAGEPLDPADIAPIPS